MRIVIDTADEGEAFEVLSQYWLRLGLKLGHWTTFSWMGRQLVQLPDDVLRLAEAVWQLRPGVIVETGVYEGGSALLFASLCRMTGRGRVISVEAAPRPGVREALAAHGVKLIEGDSASPDTAERVRRLIRPGEQVFVFLDSDHSRNHVRAELEHYSPLVSPGSYIVVADTILEGEDTPGAAVAEFLKAHPEFIAGRPDPRFQAQADFGHLSYFSDGWLKRR
ncbi:MAG: CmcI family methyltransferase [Bryobacteraceae bacterium]|nr:CmcI family methyltransferase [Bryobacteraceae bacterium]